ncbi:NAD-dependent succinate-semialdehyde dehydrogenase [Staphylococcus succinus]|jgi:succinate-semialdehyde dehydrogenase/glutarate-semialdehyde dehydrogenase|uniref:Succinate-semialdehyde dehydrogenase (NADP(+)) n=2 Tax=Staphylococcus succinus TaxID=61015 RepID=A0A9Q6HQV6_9STAP|nr:NAD-dependent succinate-semialdehyde dehydrogenase [Staphylococcus succinus]MBU0438566.1 NAD-dependent succinate-semialdehyde dehydrogenase [Staphylococcus succinus]MEB8127434.1 NAD-dependent succinate-semialdehyde dehydrogenase [Staphylococcus succinus]MEB8210272.1 NAD-dependent succinate-semialdehyde dehydrogenase [Staphylococcus succinus]PTI44237.1 succinate-semialdehyde dehydrogenase (NADP(+)) [Staphylococcus succinus]PTI47828.1 succinate-semialdehyde dehydrogenase (NADP(+)) [Staphyloco
MTQLEVTNPATNEVIERLEYTSHEDIHAQIERTHQAFEKWKYKDAHERSAKLLQWATLIDEHQDELARLITLEGGKPLAEAKGEVIYANSYVKWYAEEAKRVYGRTIPANTPSKKIVVDKFPVGVVGAITPWNFPAAMITRKIAPALAAGCTIICKPAVKTPLTTIRLVELAHEAGIPKDAVSYIIASGKDAGDIFTSHELINKVTFTGSTGVGKTLIEQSAQTVKNVTMELGGLAPFIVHKDADLEAAVDGTIASKFRNAGQTCICANRIYVHEDIADQYIESLTEKVHDLKVGNGLDEGVKVGPVIDANAVKKVLSHITDAQDKGGKLSRSVDDIQSLGGNFLKPVVISNANTNMKAMYEETFGPVAPVMTYSDLDEVIRIANDTEFGLASYFFTNDYRTGLKLFNELDYGVIGWNDGGPSAAHAPFGGLKESGYGREGGTEGIEPYLETKYLSVEV